MRPFHVQRDLVVVRRVAPGSMFEIRPCPPGLTNNLKIEIGADTVLVVEEIQVTAGEGYRIERRGLAVGRVDEIRVVAVFDDRDRFSAAVYRSRLPVLPNVTSSVP